LTKIDDSKLDPDDRRAIEERAKRLLDRASAWGRFPTPIDDILSAAQVTVAPTSIFDPGAILAYLRGKAASTASLVKKALSKVFGLYDAHENLIHIDNTLTVSKQNFLKLHETAHHDIPTHRKTFRFFEDCDQTLDPQIADQFEREANNFARFALFQGGSYALMAADCALEIKTPIRLAKTFGASIYASAREFARTHHRVCAIYVLEPIEFVEGHGARALVRRIETSPSFAIQFGRPVDVAITLDHPLGKALPIGRKMTRPVVVTMVDRNGTQHECIAEAFDTTFNVLILVYSAAALSDASKLMPVEFT